MSKEVPDIGKLAAELKAAADEYETTETLAKSAEAEKTAAMNRLNNAQEAIDKWYSAMRSNSPWNTAWYNDRKKNKNISA